MLPFTNNTCSDGGIIAASWRVDRRDHHVKHQFPAPREGERGEAMTREGLTCVLSVKVVDPEIPSGGSQTKDKLVPIRGAASAVENLVNEKLENGLRSIRKRRAIL